MHFTISMLLFLVQPNQYWHEQDDKKYISGSGIPHND
jgi:hypothetical protein